MEPGAGGRVVWPQVDAKDLAALRDKSIAVGLRICEDLIDPVGVAETRHQCVLNEGPYRRLDVAHGVQAVAARGCLPDEVLVEYPVDRVHVLRMLQQPCRERLEARVDVCREVLTAGYIPVEVCTPAIVDAVEGCAAGHVGQEVGRATDRLVLHVHGDRVRQDQRVHAAKAGDYPVLEEDFGVAWHEVLNLADYAQLVVDHRHVERDVAAVGHVVVVPYDVSDPCSRDVGVLVNLDAWLPLDLGAGLRL